MSASIQMQQALNYFVKKGFRVQSQTDTQAQLLKPKQKSCLLTAILFILGVIPGLVFLALSTEKSILLIDYGDRIEASSDKYKTRSMTYDEISEGNYSKLYRPGMNPFLAAAISIILIFAIIGSLTSNEDSQKTIDMERNNYLSPLSVLDFATYPDNYKDKLLRIDGCEVFNVLSKKQFQCDYQGEAIVVYTFEEYENLYPNDIITVYGTGDGKVCGENAFGVELCQPKINKAFFDK